MIPTQLFKQKKQRSNHTHGNNRGYPFLVVNQRKLCVSGPVARHRRSFEPKGILCLIHLTQNTHVHSSICFAVYNVGSRNRSSAHFGPVEQWLRRLERVEFPCPTLLSLSYHTNFNMHSTQTLSIGLTSPYCTLCPL